MDGSLCDLHEHYAGGCQRRIVEDPAYDIVRPPKPKVTTQRPDGSLSKGRHLVQICLTPGSRLLQPCERYYQSVYEIDVLDIWDCGIGLTGKDEKVEISTVCRFNTLPNVHSIHDT